jgi:uncharacterized membrane protein YdbT with pleckstrin-like domain
VGFPRKLLNEGEEVVLDLRPHWWALAAPFGAVLLGLATVVAVAALGASQVVVWIAGAPLAVVFLWFVARYAQWANTSFVLTTHRLIWRSGVLAKQGREIPLERINDISFRQSFFARLIGAGDLMIESAGERGQEALHAVRRPSQVQNAVYREIEHLREREADRVAGRRELSIPEQIEKLDELRQRGALTQEEFDAKKAQLLNRL